jgi:hypothetical protein
VRDRGERGFVCVRASGEVRFVRAFSLSGLVSAVGHGSECAFYCACSRAFVFYLDECLREVSCVRALGSCAFVVYV